MICLLCYLFKINQFLLDHSYLSIKGLNNDDEQLVLNLKLKINDLTNSLKIMDVDYQIKDLKQMYKFIVEWKNY